MMPPGRQGCLCIKIILYLRGKANMGGGKIIDYLNIICYNHSKGDE